MRNGSGEELESEELGMGGLSIVGVTPTSYGSGR